MNLCVVAYKFGTEAEIGKHLGTYHYFIEKMRTLVRQGHSVTVVCPWLSFTKLGSLEVDGVKIIRTWPPLWQPAWAWPLNRSVRWLHKKATQHALLKLTRSEKFDAIYIWQAREVGVAVLAIKKQLGIPVWFRQITAWKWHFERTVEEVLRGKFFYCQLQNLGLAKLFEPALRSLLDIENQKAFARRIYAEADQVVLLSEAAVDEAVAFGLDRTKAKVLGVAIEEALFRPRTDRAALRKTLGMAEAPTLLFIGRISYAEKGVGWLLEAMPEVLRAIPAARLVIIGGGGESARMQADIARLGIGASVQLAGKQPFERLADFLAASDVQVVPSLWMEAFGQVTIEGMSCGIPVVTSDAGASPEINLHEQTGLVVPAGDRAALAQALIRVLSDESLRKTFGAAARERVLAEYTYNALTKKFIQYLLTLRTNR